MTTNNLFRKWLLSSLVLITALVTPAPAEFIGKFELGPSGCEESGLCTLTYDFKYRDPDGIEWQANAENKTDGASIPQWAQPFIGRPFDRSYIKAAVIHDHYCVRQVRSWRQTHRVFYDALLELGVGENKAMLMYYAVYLGGPKWVELIPGHNCGTNCLNSFKGGEKRMQTRPAEYDRTDFHDELKEVQLLLDSSASGIRLSDLEERARRKRPNDFYFRNGDRVETNSALPVE